MTQSLTHTATRTAGDEVAVWDPYVRLFHWSLVTAFAAAYLTGDEVLAVHVWAGYAVGSLIVLRVLWGFVGPRHARFADFAFGPLTILDDLRDIVRFSARRYLGHSPAGGAMVLLLLASLTAVVGTGLVTHAIRNNAGPLAGVITADTSSAGPAVAAAPVGKEGQLEGRGRRAPKPGRAWKNVHELLANVVLILIGLHLAGVLFSSFAHRENLVRAMITGRKPADPG